MRWRSFSPVTCRKTVRRGTHIHIPLRTQQAKLLTLNPAQHPETSVFQRREITKTKILLRGTTNSWPPTWQYQTWPLQAGLHLARHGMLWRQRQQIFMGEETSPSSSVRNTGVPPSLSLMSLKQNPYGNPPHMQHRCPCYRIEKKLSRRWWVLCCNVVHNHYLPSPPLDLINILLIKTSEWNNGEMEDGIDLRIYINIFTYVDVIILKCLYFVDEYLRT